MPAQPPAGAARGPAQQPGGGAGLRGVSAEAAERAGGGGALGGGRAAKWRNLGSAPLVNGVYLWGASQGRPPAGGLAPTGPLPGLTASAAAADGARSGLGVQEHVGRLAAAACESTGRPAGGRAPKQPQKSRARSALRGASPAALSGSARVSGLEQGLGCPRCRHAAGGCASCRLGRG